MRKNSNNYMKTSKDFQVRPGSDAELFMSRT